MGCATLEVEACDGESDGESDAGAESEVLADADAETPGGRGRFGAAAGLGVLHAADTPAATAITAPTIACRHMPISRPRRASRGALQSAQVHTLLADVAAVVAYLSRSTLDSETQRNVVGRPSSVG